MIMRGQENFADYFPQFPLSLLSSTTLLLLPSYASPQALVLVSLVNTTLLFAPPIYMSRFWNKSTQMRIPFLEKFNEAIQGSEKVVSVLGTLVVGWGVGGLVWWMEGGNAVWVLAVGLRIWYWVQMGAL
ncbi:hypothetical protein IAQ61_011009 [Plenodomus lingam]|uniref:uncharacterized protein n=1 Tax=Leptosphaeria maculans TaxID=5022 RepID=UPI00331A20B8|nr:hypothetical protein IAQ61_011009 [Plenodomus lingam]